MSDILSIKALTKLCNPFKGCCWEGLDRPITSNEIRAALAAPIPPSAGAAKTREQHAARIAWFVLNGWNDPIEVDIGIPSLGCYVRWPVTDGNHRFAAAIFRHDKTIAGSFGGDLNLGEEIGLLLKSAA